MAAFPIVDHDRNEVFHQPPGLGLIGVLALPGSALTAAHKHDEARARLHNQPHAEAPLVVDDSGYQIEARYEEKAEESDPHDDNALALAHAPQSAAAQLGAINKRSIVAGAMTAIRHRRWAHQAIEIEQMYG